MTSSAEPESNPTPPASPAATWPELAPPALAQRLTTTWQPRVRRGLKTAPVWVPLALLAHIALFGLVPALVESHRLTIEERALLERLDGAHAQGTAAERLREAQQDPIYLEREMRAARFAPSERAGDARTSSAPAEPH